VIHGFNQTRVELKKLKSALNNSSAPIVEVDLSRCSFANPEIKQQLDEFIIDHYAKFQSKNYWANTRKYQKIIR
jgi:hypothetical protein